MKQLVEVRIDGRRFLYSDSGLDVTIGDRVDVEHKGRTLRRTVIGVTFFLDSKGRELPIIIKPARRASG